ncbi:MAG TPA: hypothetical protein VF663_12955 [Telluria sp.]
MTNTGLSSLNGDVGTTSGPAMAGIESTALSGTVHSGGPAAMPTHFDGDSGSGDAAVTTVSLKKFPNRQRCGCFRLARLHGVSRAKTNVSINQPES